MRTKRVFKSLALSACGILLLGNVGFAGGFNPSMQAYIEELKSEAKAENPNFQDFDAKRGEVIFSTKTRAKTTPCYPAKAAIMWI